MADDYGFPRGEKDADLIALTKAATKNKHGKDLTEADFIAVEIAMASAMVGTRQAGRRREVLCTTTNTRLGSRRLSCSPSAAEAFPTSSSGSPGGRSTRRRSRRCR
jgi:hypothetical protein